MAAFLHKLLRKNSQIKTITTNLKTPFQSNLSTPIFQSNLIDFKPNTDSVSDLKNPILFFPNNENALSKSQLFYPSFPFGYFLNPNTITQIKMDDAVEEVSEDEKTVWADSVKKKRKKKMNKHKLKKLRKRLRRQT
ncbi:hypothetical protein C5167_035053 [Papaver somniferum]|uniref:Small ribosomal subunit protein mS38 n=1 Tax=Papaver somniferum TaxID=3469 RepID=A0A4Y7KD54_PAPSO|nr:hypothetical protein C5167_035053 [Papaver somniferum]